MARRDPDSWTLVRLPERELADILLEVATPLFEKLGSAPTLDEARAVLATTIAVWNASVLASTRWERPRVKELNALKKQMRGRGATPEQKASFDLLVERCRPHDLDPRLVEAWSYELGAGSSPRLVCTVALPKGVEAETPPPAEKRVAIGGRFLDEVSISLGSNMALSFPVDRHSGRVADDGTATVYAMMPTALQLYADGHLPRVGGEPVQVVIGGRALGPMVLAQLMCGGGEVRHDVAVLVFRPVDAGVGS